MAHCARTLTRPFNSERFRSSYAALGVSDLALHADTRDRWRECTPRPHQQRHASGHLALLLSHHFLLLLTPPTHDYHECDTSESGGVRLVSLILLTSGALLCSLDIFTPGEVLKGGLLHDFCSLLNGNKLAFMSSVHRSRQCLRSESHTQFGTLLRFETQH